MMSSQLPSQAVTTLSVALGRLGVTSLVRGQHGKGHTPRPVALAVCTSHGLHHLAGRSVRGVKSGAMLSAGKGHHGVL